MDANGKKYLSHIADYEYDPWGRVLSVKDSSGRDISNEPNNSAAINPFRYRGYYYDTESGFYYLQSRYYDPAISRFINADSYASTGIGYLGYNMFAYCCNNAIAFKDDSGCRMMYVYYECCGNHRVVPADTDTINNLNEFNELYAPITGEALAFDDGLESYFDERGISGAVYQVTKTTYVHGKDGESWGEILSGPGLEAAGAAASHFGCSALSSLFGVTGKVLAARTILYAVRDKVIPDEIPTNTALVRYDIVINWNDPHYQVEAVSYTQTYFFDLKQDGTVNMYKMYTDREAGEFIGGFCR